MNPKHGTLVRKGIPRDQVIPVVKQILELYVSGAEKFKEELGAKARLYHVLEKMGFEQFEQAIEEVLSNKA